MNSQEIHLHVCAKFRLLRKSKSASLKLFSHQLGMSSQRVNKIERGEGRLSASTIHDAARILGVEISDFYEGLPNTHEFQPSSMGEFIFSEEFSDISENMARLSRKRRKAVLELIKAIADSEQKSRAHRQPDHLDT